MFTHKLRLKTANLTKNYSGWCYCWIEKMELKMYRRKDDFESIIILMPNKNETNALALYSKHVFIISVAVKRIVVSIWSDHRVKDAHSFFLTQKFTALKSGRSTQSTHMLTHNTLSAVKSFVFGSNTFLFLVFSFVHSYNFSNQFYAFSGSVIQPFNKPTWRGILFILAWDFFLWFFFSLILNTMCVLVHSNFKIPLPANVKTRMQ